MSFCDSSLPTFPPLYFCAFLRHLDLCAPLHAELSFPRNAPLLWTKIPASKVGRITMQAAAVQWLFLFLPVNLWSCLSWQFVKGLPFESSFFSLGFLPLFCPASLSVVLSDFRCIFSLRLPCSSSVNCSWKWYGFSVFPCQAFLHTFVIAWCAPVRYAPKMPGGSSPRGASVPVAHGAGRRVRGNIRGGLPGRGCCACPGGPSAACCSEVFSRAASPACLLITAFRASR